MVDILIIECRSCGVTYNGDNESKKIGELEQIGIVYKKQSRCIYCPKTDRNTAKPGGPNFSGWDEDVWQKKQ